MYERVFSFKGIEVREFITIGARRMESLIEFAKSLGITGYIVFLVMGLCLLNFKKIFNLRSALDSPPHKSWKDKHGLTPPDDYRVGFPPVGHDSDH